MSHEIYYTSAPEGLKRGTSGFSTVASSANIPKALWDRLETLSAYRHQFGAHAEGQAEAGTPAGGGRNPVSHAHWILTVTGKTYHVLSRICDSGVDHTQRTNAFAHHLVLERGEIEAAAGGPAWMLNQPGVMANAWDGRVGDISRSSLPTGDSTGSRICRAWEAISGDAGWAGHLADVFVKTPTRPVCILFSPGQELLPLIAEALALLPAPTRWNVTFNTYFTSMPTSATCLWRCCLAGTPAAQVGLRYAANGLVLDLTDRSRLPALSPGPYVNAARTGQGAEPAAGAPVSAKTKPAAPGKPAFGKPKGQGSAIDPEDAADEARREAIFDFADESQPATDIVQPTHDGPPVRSSEEMPSSLIDIAGSYNAQNPAAATPAGQARANIPRRPIRRAEQALEEAESSADLAAQRRRKQVMWLFAAALGAIGIGTGLVYIAYNKSVPPDIAPAPTLTNRPKPEIVKPAPPPPEIVQNPSPPPPTSRGPIVVEPAPPPPPVMVPRPATPQFPETLTLALPLKRPAAGSGIGESKQSLPLAAKDLETPAKITAVHLHLPVSPARSGRPAGENIYQNDLLGTLSVGEGRAGTPGTTITWKAPKETGPGTDALFIAYDRNVPGLEFQWKLAAILKKPEVTDLIYWIVQSSKIELVTTPARARNQQVLLKPFEPAPVFFTQAVSEVAWPAALPKDVGVTPPSAQSLAKGWEATWYTDWDSKDTPLRTAENASQVLKFKKTTTVPGIDALFLITFRPGIAKVESTFAKRFDADQAALADNESKLRAITARIDDATRKFGPLPPDAQGTKDALAEQEQAAKFVDAYKAVVAGYNELTHFDVALDLPDGLRLTTLHFQRTDRATDAGK